MERRDQDGELQSSQAALIQTACAMLVARYCHLADLREHAAFSELFTHDGEWIRPGMHMRGREEIFRFMDARPLHALTRHVCGSIHIEVIDEDHARGLSYTTVYRQANYRGSGSAKLMQPEMVVDYRDDYVRLEGRWHFRKRQTTVVFSDKA